MKISAKELRSRPTQIIEQAARGTEVIITVRGKKMAKLIPYTSDTGQSIDQDDEIFGLWKDHAETTTVDEQVRRLRKGRTF
jgi:prevent-host-death family protein